MTTSATESNSAATVLVVGATGATGKWVVKLLLDGNAETKVKVIVRSKERMLSILQELNSDDNKVVADYGDRLEITEASLLELSDSQLQELVQGCTAIVSCLGHNLNFQGLWGAPRKLVTEAVKRLTNAIAAAQTTTSTKFILMGSDGVANPNGNDDKRTILERAILFALRHLIPPHADNESAAAYLHSLLVQQDVEWAVIRPTDLQDGLPTGKYELFDKPQGGLFGAGIATRSHVAQCMVEFILDPLKWEHYKFQMPVLHDTTTTTTPADNKKSEL